MRIEKESGLPRISKENPRCLEYVISHEMGYLKERKHSDKFKNIMAEYLPNWRAVKRELFEIIFYNSPVDKFIRLWGWSREEINNTKFVNFNKINIQYISILRWY